MLSIVGGAAAFVIAIASAVGVITNGGIGGGPWDQATPPIATHVAGSTVWSGDGGALIRLTEAEFNGAPLVATVNQGYRIELYVSSPEDVGLANPPYPNYIDTLRDDEIGVVVSTGPITELWVNATGPWAINLKPIEAQVITDTLTGQGNAVIMYEGDAVSARFVHNGGGIFFVNVYSAGTVDRPIIESGEVDLRAAWQPSDIVIFTIESDADRGAWTIDIDELAGSTSNPNGPSNGVTPTPSPTPEQRRTT